MLHAHFIADIYHILVVMLFLLISLSCSHCNSGGCPAAARLQCSGRRDQIELSCKDPELWPTDTSWHMGGKGTLLKISHYTSHITQERGLLNEPWNQQKSQQTGSTELFNSWRPGAVCIANVTVSLSVWSCIPEEQDRNRQGEAETWLLTYCNSNIHCPRSQNE